MSALPAESEPPAAKSTSLPSDAGVGERARGPHARPSRGRRRRMAPKGMDAERRRPRRPRSSAPPAAGTQTSSPPRPRRGIRVSSIAMPISGARDRTRSASPRREPRRQLDVSDAIGLELLRVAAIRRRLRAEALDRPGPQRSVPREPAPSTSVDVQRGHAPWRGNVTVPQRRHSEPSSPVRRPCRRTDPGRPARCHAARASTGAS